MRKIVLLLTYLIMTQPCIVLAASSNSPPPKLPQVTKEQEQNKAERKTQDVVTGDRKEWLENVEKVLPQMLCTPKEYFVECFNVGEQECKEFTHLLVRACLNNVQLALPPQIDKQQGEYWGKIVGKCSYDLYEKFMQNKKIPKPGCDYFPSKKENSSEAPAKSTEETK